MKFPTKNQFFRFQFIRTANNVFEQYGHNADILDYIKSYL